MALTKVTTEVIADDNVTLAKLEDGTQGDILYYGASGAPARLGFGTDGDFLKTQGTGANPVWATAGGGKVLQVLMGTSNTPVINTTDVYADTGLTITITPSDTSSKILILANHGTIAKKMNTTLHLKLLRDVTDINAWGTGWLVYSDSDTTLGISGTFTYLDSPSSTSAIVYKTQFKSEGTGGSKEVRVMPGPADGSIIALEIGA